MANENIRLDDYGDGSEPQSSRPKFYAAFLLIIIAVMAAYLTFRWYEVRQLEDSVGASAAQLK